MKKKYWILIFLLSVLIVAAFFSCRSFWRYASTVHKAENVSNVNELHGFLRHLPISAKNISYTKIPMLMTMFEYEVSEEDFLDWAKSKDVTLSKISEPVSIFRYSSYQLELPKSDDPNEWDDYELRRRAVIIKGYHYLLTITPDSYVQIVYDSEKKKAYYYSCHR